MVEKAYAKAVERFKKEEAVRKKKEADQRKAQSDRTKKLNAEIALDENRASHFTLNLMKADYALDKKDAITLTAETAQDSTNDQTEPELILSAGDGGASSSTPQSTPCSSSSSSSSSSSTLPNAESGDPLVAATTVEDEPPLDPVVGEDIVCELREVEERAYSYLAAAPLDTAQALKTRAPSQQSSCCDQGAGIHLCDRPGCSKKVCNMCETILDEMTDIRVCAECAAAEVRPVRPHRKTSHVMKTKVRKQLSTSVKMLLGSIAVANSIVCGPNRFAGVDFKEVLSTTGNLSGQALDRGLMVSIPVHPDTGYNLTMQEDRDEVEYEMMRDDPFLSVVNFEGADEHSAYVLDLVNKKNPKKTHIIMSLSLIHI